MTTHKTNTRNGKPFNYTSIIAWSFYDWANSAYPAVITTFVFATYFTEKVAANKTLGTSQWALAVGIAGLLVAIISPIVGAIADNRGGQKSWLMCFTVILIITTALFWFIEPYPSYVVYALCFMVVSTIGFEVATVFYNSMLPHLAPSSLLGRISGWAWGLGYAGGLVCLVLVLEGFVSNPTPWFGVTTTNMEQIRVVGPFVAAWTAIFSLPLLLFTPDSQSHNKSIVAATKDGLKTLWTNLKNLPQQPTILHFLIARMIYIDGLNTLFAFGGIYAAGRFDMTLSDVIVFGIASNIFAAIGAAGVAWLDDYIGSRLTILISIAILVTLGAGIVITNNTHVFWVLAMGVAFFVGPIQASSRAMMVRLAPPEQISELFGLYALSGKATAFLCPWVLSIVTLTFDSQRAGMVVILSFILAGGIWLYTVKDQQKEAQVND